MCYEAMQILKTLTNLLKLTKKKLLRWWFDKEPERKQQKKDV